MERDPNWEPSEHLKAKVHYLAWRWSMGRLELIDDLYQEGLLAIWLHDEGHAQLNHQLRTAQNRMIDVRKRGRSVDGRMNSTSARAKTWTVLSLDEMMYGIPPHSRAVEAYVVDKLAVAEIMALLDRSEVEVLGLVYAGFSQREIAQSTGQPLRRLQRTMHDIREKVSAHRDGRQRNGANGDDLRYAQTRASATNTDCPWTQEEDRIVLERLRDPAHEVALDLGRTLWAVRHRRSRLLKAGRR